MSIRTNKRIKKIILAFFFLIIFFMSSLEMGLAAPKAYDVNLNKGTSTFVVNKYDEEDWEENVNEELEPDDFFGGDSDEVGAKSRITIRNVGDYREDMFDILVSVFNILDILDSAETLSVNDTLILMGLLDEKSIDLLFPDKYEAWESIAVRWDYESDQFDEEPDEDDLIIPIFKDPSDFKEILENYNEWALYTNATLLSLGLKPFPLLNGDEFIWQLLKEGRLIIASPFKTYLNEVIDELECRDVEVREEGLMIEKEGEEDYKIVVRFNQQGIVSELIVKDIKDRIIYEIVEDTSDVVFLIVAGIVIASLTAVIIVIIRRRIEKTKE
ncbi:MAG: hypothetical protein EU539_01915 [Promethearchaeota archaeon]|nr:MAG: hypothetical protein EU539_01915 [Candidatus Lokiarchaeota archaeon]